VPPLYHSHSSLQGVSTKTTASCLASTNIITVLQMVPYKLHSPDLQSAVFTINKIYNVQATFFDIADPLFGTTPAPGKSLPPFASGGYAGKPWREYNKFSLNFPLPNTIAGSSNWMEYTIVFNKQADVSPTCLAPFKDFFFINADGTCQGCA
jgi:hypothetical protein